MNRIYLIGLMLLAVGCASTEKIERELTTYVGGHIDRAVERLGRPDRVTDMQNGTKEYEWVTRGTNATVNTSVMGLPVPKGKPRDCKSVLLVDEKKQVIGHTVEGKC